MVGAGGHAAADEGIVVMAFAAVNTFITDGGDEFGPAPFAGGAAGAFGDVPADGGAGAIGAEVPPVKGLEAPTGLAGEMPDVLIASTPGGVHVVGLEFVVVAGAAFGELF